MINIQIEDEAIQSMRILCNINLHLEWAAELWGYIDGQSVIITDLLLIKQVVSQCEINQSLSKEQRNQYHRESRYYHMLKNKLGQGKKLVGWVHSHNTMEAFLSETDRFQIKNYFKNDPSLKSLLSFVVSSKRQKNRNNKLFHKILRRTKVYVPGIEIKLWIDGIFNNKSYFNQEISLKKYKFNSKRSINSLVSQSLIQVLVRFH